MFLLRPFAVLLSVLASLALAGTAFSADLAALVGNLTTGGFSEREAAITALATSGEERAAPILEALAAGQLYVRNADKLVVIGKTDGNKLALSEAISGKAAGSAVEADLDRVRVNNRLRGTIEAAVGSLTLMSPNPRCASAPPTPSSSAAMRRRWRPSIWRLPPKRTRASSVR
jgi:urea transport system permease protein